MVQKNIVPAKLTKGDEVRVIAPSRSLNTISAENIREATRVLESLDLKVTFGKHVYEEDLFHSSSIQSRIDDLHATFQDKTVKAILPVIGGSNANQLLAHIDYEIIRANPKIFCGFSDITALQAAIYHKTGLVTYSGPHFSSFAMKKGFDYTLAYFKKIFFQDSPIHITSSDTWSDDAWFQDQENRTFHTNEGYWLIQTGDTSREITGTIIGGNLCTLQLLHGTPYMPSLKDTILFLEADSITQGHCVVEFDRDLQSLIHQPGFETVKAIIIGRFETKFDMDKEKLTAIVKSKHELSHLPIIANSDFGHTMPMLTFPIGGTCSLRIASSEVGIVLSDH